MNNRQEQIEQARRLIATGISADLVEVLVQQFPELAENEDDRVRNLIYCIVRDNEDVGRILKANGVTVEQALAYLEKQKEKKPAEKIQWTGKNLKEVIDFTGLSPKFGEWFKSWDEYENYVHTHNDILKIFCEDGSHYEVPVGAWIVKTPDGHNIPSVAQFVQKPAEWSEEDLQHKSWILECLADGERKMPEYAEDFRAAYNWLKSLRPQPKQEWSEEDIMMWESALWHVKNSCGNGSKNSGEFEVYNWLKSLRSRIAWKPSEEQMEAIEEARILLHDEAIISQSNKIFYHFESLIRDLKKL